jgi:hypothetical protein
MDWSGLAVAGREGGGGSPTRGEREELLPISSLNEGMGLYVNN